MIVKSQISPILFTGKNQHIHSYGKHPQTTPEGGPTNSHYRFSLQKYVLASFFCLTALRLSVNCTTLRVPCGRPVLRVASAAWPLCLASLILGACRTPRSLAGTLRLAPLGRVASAVSCMVPTLPWTGGGRFYGPVISMICALPSP